MQIIRLALILSYIPNLKLKLAGWAAFDFKSWFKLGDFVC